MFNNPRPQGSHSDKHVASRRGDRAKGSRSRRLSIITGRVTPHGPSPPGERNVQGEDKHQNKKTKRTHYGKEKQRRPNDSSETAGGEATGWQRSGEESSRRSKDHEHLSAWCREIKIRRPFCDGLLFYIVPAPWLPRGQRLRGVRLIIRGRVTPHSPAPAQGLGCGRR